MKRHDINGIPLPLICDIDDTLMQTEVVYDNGDAIYTNNVQPIQEQIDALNVLKKAGHRVILHTGRDWKWYDVTLKQLDKYGILYDQLIMGKPSGIVIDADAVVDIRELL